MINKKVFGKWIMKIFAAVMKFIAPTLCVKQWTVKNTSAVRIFGQDPNERAKAFLPGVKREMRAIRKLKFTDAQLRERIWSRETMVSLLKASRYALVERITSSDEDMLNILVEQRDFEALSSAFKAATPKKEYLRKFLFENVNLALIVCGRVPQAFNDFSLKELPQDKEYRQDLLMKFLNVDVTKNPKVAEHWATEVVNYNIKDFSLEDSERELMATAMFDLRLLDYDFSEMLVDLRVYHPDFFAEVTQFAPKSSHFAAYVCKLLPVMARNYNASVKEIAEESRTWITLAKNGMFHPDIQESVLQLAEIKDENPDEFWKGMQEKLIDEVADYEIILVALKKLPASYRTELESKLVNAVKTPMQAKEAMKLVDEKYHKKLVTELIRLATKPQDSNVLVDFFPFTDSDWETVAEEAVRKLASWGKLPVERLEELNSYLRDAAVEEWEIQSEIEALDHGFGTDLMRHKLHGRAEQILFHNSYLWMEKLVPLYVEQNCMDDDSFKTLVSYDRDKRNYSISRYIPDIVKIHAEKHGLSEKNYMDLMNSPYYSYLAPTLKNFKRGKMPPTAEA